MNSKGTKQTSFTDPCIAQEFYLQQSSPRFWHWSFANGRYCLEYKKGQDASDKVVDIQLIGEEESYVYDIETEDGSFQCGVGCMILKNTDSIYTKFMLPDHDNLSESEILDKVANVSEECALRITKTFKPPIQLEFEKIMYPLLLFTKKQYAYLGWEPGKNGIEQKGIDIKGLPFIKREFCPLVKHIGRTILDKVLKDRDPEGAEKIARIMIQDLLQGNVKIEDLVMSKRLKGSYKEVNKNGDKLKKPAHWFLAERMKKRDPMNAPKAGDRVSYVFIENENRNALQCDRIEDPEYVEENAKTCKIDSIYYLKKQVTVPMYTIFSCIITDENGKLYEVINNKIPKACRDKIDKLWVNSLRQKENQVLKQNQITRWFLQKKNPQSG